MKKILKITLYFFLIIIFAALGFGGGFVFYLYKNLPTTEILSLGDLKIHFFSLGNSFAGDCILIQSGDYDILIDAGSRNSSASTIIDYVDKFVDDNTIEFVIATHADQDHISAFYSTTSNEGIFEHYKVNTIIDFPKTNKNTSTLKNYYEARDKEVQDGANHYSALECFNNENGAQRFYQLSNNVEMEILYNYYYENNSSNENNYSVCIMFNQGENHYLFTGDLEEEGENKMVDYYEQIGDPLPECLFYKAGHHGSYTASGEKLMATIKPRYVVVTCCAGTSEYTTIEENKFPSQNFINNVAKYTENIYIPTMVKIYEENGEKKESYQDMNGSIIISINSGNVIIECSNNNKKLMETEWFKENRIWPN